jgi:hypothetical protein
MSNSPNPSSGDDDDFTIPALEFLRTLADIGDTSSRAALRGAIRTTSGALATAAVAIIVLVRDPILFIREYLLGGFLVILVETAIRGFFGLLAQLAAELQLVATQLWDGTVGTLLGVGASIMDEAIEPAVLGVQAGVAAGFETLGLAAPFAAALSIGLTAILVVLATTVVFELLRWALPIGALTRPAASTLSGARAALSNRLFGSGGDR